MERLLKRVEEGRRFAEFRTGAFMEYAGRAFANESESMTETQV